MFFDEIRRAAESAPRVNLPDVTKALWSAFAAGHIDEDQAEDLSGLIEARRVLPPRKPAGSGSRPRTPESIERRRRWAAAGRLPQHLAAKFSLAEQAALSVIAVEVMEKGDCRLAIGHIAALAGVSETSVRNAVREAKHLGLVTVEERRLSRWRNDPNIVRIASVEWITWLSIGGQEGGCKSAQGSIPLLVRGGRETVRNGSKGYRKEARGEAMRQDASPMRIRPRGAPSMTRKRTE